MQMMNVAMQLLQSKGMAPAPGLGMSGALPPTDAPHAGTAPTQGESANTERVPVPTAELPAVPADGAMPVRMGFKPQAAQAGAFTAAMGSQGFSFPPLGPMPAGWPPAEMNDHSLDSKLRPPAA